MSEQNGHGDSEQMRYAVTGGEAPSTDAALEKYTGEIAWADLQPHYESGALLWLDPAQDLTDIGRALAEDDSSRVDALMKSGDLIKPGPPHAEHWQHIGARFRALVVSPFVLAQPLED